MLTRTRLLTRPLLGNSSEAVGGGSWYTLFSNSYFAIRHLREGGYAALLLWPSSKFDADAFQYSSVVHSTAAGADEDVGDEPDDDCPGVSDAAPLVCDIVNAAGFFSIASTLRVLS